MTDAHALEVQTLFRGVVIGTKHVTRTRRGRRRPLFVIGSSARADAPVPAQYLAPGTGREAPQIASWHALVTAVGDGQGDGDDRDRRSAGHDDGRYAVCLTPQMTGVLWCIILEKFTINC